MNETEIRWIIGFIGFLIAAIKLSYTIHNFRYNNKKITKILKINQYSKMSVKTNNGKEFQIFSVKIKNIGIPYNNPKVEIEGYETNGCCINVVLLRQKNGESTNEDFEFKKGMIQEYALKSTELHPMSSKLLSGCVTAKCPNMNIKISCDDEVITRLPIKLIYPIVIWNHLIKEILFKHIKFFKKYKFLIVENPYFKLKTYLIKC